MELIFKGSGFMKKITLIATRYLVVLSLWIGVSCDPQTNESQSDESPRVILINAFEVPEGKLEASIQYWESCRDFLQDQPGYVSTKLHQSIGGKGKFALVNVAVWENQKVFSEATKKMFEELQTPRVEGLKGNPSLYTVIRE